MKWKCRNNKNFLILNDEELDDLYNLVRDAEIYYFEEFEKYYNDYGKECSLIQETLYKFMKCVAISKTFPNRLISFTECLTGDYEPDLYERCVDRMLHN